MNYEIQIDRKAEKAIRKLPKNIRERMIDAIFKLKDDPHPVGSRKMEGAVNLYRIKIAKNYRFVYAIENDQLMIIIVGAGHRKDIYRKM